MPTAIITGASQGLGRALARALAAQGWSLVIDARRAGPLEELEHQLTAAGATVRALVGDITDERHRVELVENALALGNLELLVNNADALGPSPLPGLDRLELSALRPVYETNVVTPLGLVQLALPALQQSKGVVVAISSDAAVEGYEGWGGYGSSKAALNQLFNVLAQEQPSLGVYAFDPGDMQTEMHQQAFPGEDISDRPEPESVVPAFLRLLAERPPSGRYRASEWVAR